MTQAPTYGFETTAEDVTEGLDLSGKSYLITGCNSGLGLETARVLVLRGAHIVGGARTEEKAKNALAPFGENATGIACELSDAASVRACATQLLDSGRKLDAIICNAGVMALPEARTTHGLDLQFLTNHIGHFILVNEALDALTDRGRVVVVSSGAHRRAPEDGIEFDNLSGERDYQPWKMYGQSKLANILFARELSKRFGDSGQTANSLHPGVIHTNLTRHLENPEGMLNSMRLKSIAQGAATQCAVATRPELAATAGQYFIDATVHKTNHPHATNDELAAKLWARSEQIAASL